MDLRAGERKPAHAYSQERAGDAAKPHPNFPRHWAADNRAQRQCTLPAGLQFKNGKSGCPTGMGRVSFSSTQSSSWLGRRATKPQLQRGKGELKEARHIRGRKRGSVDERNNNNLGCITLLRLLHIFQWWRDLYREAERELVEKMVLKNIRGLGDTVEITTTISLDSNRTWDSELSQHGEEVFQVFRKKIYISTFSSICRGRLCDTVRSSRTGVKWTLWWESHQDANWSIWDTDQWSMRPAPMVFCTTELSAPLCIHLCNEGSMRCNPTIISLSVIVDRLFGYMNCWL